MGPRFLRNSRPIQGRGDGRKWAPLGALGPVFRGAHHRAQYASPTWLTLEGSGGRRHPLLPSRTSRGGGPDRRVIERVGTAAEADLVEAEPLVVRGRHRAAPGAHRPPVAAFQRRIVGFF